MQLSRKVINFRQYIGLWDEKKAQIVYIFWISKNLEFPCYGLAGVTSFSYRFWDGELLEGARGAHWLLVGFPWANTMEIFDEH